MILLSPVISFCLVFLGIKEVLTDSGSVFQVPEVCGLKTNIIGDDLRYFQISYDKESWEKYSYNKNKTCYFRLYYGSVTGQRLNVKLDIQTGYTSTCLFDIYLYPNLIEKSQPIKKLDCTESGEFSIPWPTNKVIIAFQLRPGFLSKTVSSSLAPAIIKVDAEHCPDCGFKNYGYTDEDFYDYLIPYYDVSAKSMCGSVGCLENVLQGYKVSPYVDKYSFGSKRCSLTLNIKDNTLVCVKQIADSLFVFSCSADLQPYINVYIDGTQYLQLQCYDAQQWWCFPWDVSGKTVKFSWDKKYDRSGSNKRKLFIARPSANKDAKQCGMFSPPTTTTRETPRTWTTWSSGDDFQSSDSDTGDRKAGFFVIAVTVVIAIIVLYVIYRVMKKLQKRNSEDVPMSPTECTQNLTSPNADNNDRSQGQTEINWPARLPSCSNDGATPAYVPPRTPPGSGTNGTGSNYVVPSAPLAADLDYPGNGQEDPEGLPPPCYEDVMKNSKRYLT